MHKLMHSLVRNVELARQFRLRDARSISRADEGIALCNGQERVMLRSLVVHYFNTKKTTHHRHVLPMTCHPRVCGALRFRETTFQMEISHRYTIRSGHPSLITRI